MTPATNFISVRTTFLSVVFLFAGLAAIIETRSLDIAQANYRRIILIVLSTLFVAENLNGLITNISLRAEFDHRWSIIGQKSNGTCDHAIHVPHIATQPSSLSYIQTPGHDREFLSALSRRLGCEVKHSSSTSDPLPNSFKPMKAIKFYLRHWWMVIFHFTIESVKCLRFRSSDPSFPELPAIHCENNFSCRRNSAFDV